jgi:hypothetical protein
MPLSEAPCQIHDGNALMVVVVKTSSSKLLKGFFMRRRVLQEAFTINLILMESRPLNYLFKNQEPSGSTEI